VVTTVHSDVPAVPKRSSLLAPNTVQPWRALPAMRPQVEVSDAGMASIASISRTLVSPFGFSNGNAELTLKKPPPLLPRTLMISCEATGKSSVAITPCDARTSAPTKAIGRSTRSTARCRSS
jgi:hypothetical protein